MDTTRLGKELQDLTRAKIATMDHHDAAGVVTALLQAYGKSADKVGVLVDQEVDGQMLLRITF